jgi:hypothetical protein
MPKPATAQASTPQGGMALSPLYGCQTALLRILSVDQRSDRKWERRHREETKMNSFKLCSRMSTETPATSEL